MPFEAHPVTDRASWLAMRQADVTASVAGALLGVHEYETPYSLWARKTGQLDEDAEESPAMRRGRLLEPVALQLLAEERPDWSLEPGRAYFRDPAERLGATPDAFAACPRRGRGIVQVKSVESMIFRQKWRDGETGIVEPPLWIAVQAIVEAYLTGADWACVAALVVGHGLDLEVVDVPVHSGVVERVRDATRAFWDLVESGEAPSPDYARDGATIARMFQADQGTEVDLSDDNHLPVLLQERAALKAGIKASEERCSEIEAEFKAKLGLNAVGHLAGGTTVTWKTQHRRGYSVEPTSFRVLRFPRAA
ncbi:YqaJ viral recombinase family protein [Salinarimonas soli]|uniref:YqaJ viral recombinase family protein n=1 Tax=Salinarimonas soli TaxID=1638099 RepID=A0A5B2VGM6_9HYPH|nr:YqaJ viral recombinase family protein [Salinarimonas soli]KAA2237716.1 YqaJ viral recombinase family protein [Salinarimonas soli]